jgi:hypothetical protein
VLWETACGFPHVRLRLADGARVGNFEEVIHTVGALYLVFGIRAGVAGLLFALLLELSALCAVASCCPALSSGHPARPH